MKNGQAIVSFENVGKRYWLYPSFRHLFFHFVLGSRFSRRDEFWSLKNISGEVHKGKALGIVGVNGSGKSSLLRLTAGVQLPTTGTLTVNGEMASLQDLSSGFKEDFTGVENIHFNLALRGLDDKTIAAHVNDVVDYAELNDFIERPIKTYSAGMKLRLGFALATVVPVEIMLFDEVLAVGDPYFQRKCMDRITGFKEEGATILLASHDIHTVRSFCDDVLWLHRGEVVKWGPTEEVMADYVDFLREYEFTRRGSISGEQDVEGKPAAKPIESAEVKHEPKEPAEQDIEEPASPEPQRDPEEQAMMKELNVPKTASHVSVTGFEICNENGDKSTELTTGREASFKVRCTTDRPLQSPVLGIGITRNDGVFIFGPNTQYDELDTGEIDGDFTFELKLQNLSLLPGSYMVSVGIYDKTHTHCLYYLDRGYTFKVRGPFREYGFAYMEHRWEIEK